MSLQDKYRLFLTARMYASAQVVYLQIERARHV
jgi:hypothetical protein